MDPRTTSVTMNGLRLCCHDWGPPGAPPLLLLHGITGQARSWDRVARALTPEHRVLALDLRGHGESEAAPDGDYRVVTLAADLAAVIEALALGPCVVVGHSLGGRVAIAHAAAHPEQVSRLVLVDAPAETAPGGLARIRRQAAVAPRSFASFEEAVRLVAAVRCADPGETREQLRHALRTLPDGQVTFKTDPRLLDQLASGELQSAPLWAELPRLECPVLLVRATRSDVLSPEVTGRMLAALPRGRLVELDCGHGVPFEQPAALEREIRVFLAT